ncbi:hypothetical protein RB653_004561 [Dictyostelium firmibasis]|uniref:Uncharacterized protein n=1 Tax=Dictyostelium firmibasis TaxID=79012 RepID=A0AAN7U7Q0_9MYCE
MFIVDWFYNIFLWLGFFKKEAKIVIIGLGNAGKTTLLHLLVTGNLKTHTPTIRPNADSFTFGNVNFKAYDLGGQNNLRFLWKQYIPDNKTIIVFMVDSTDYNSIIESKSEIHDILSDENLGESPLLILGSKTDAQAHYNRENLIDLLDIRRFGLGLNRPNGVPLDLLMISSVNKNGIVDMLNWLDKCTDIIKKN